MSGFANGAVVQSAEMVLLENALSVVDERAQQLGKSCWCRPVIERVAVLKPADRAQSGFSSEEQMRCSFIRILGIPPREYRNRFATSD
jgi:hypothetical protein